MITFSYSSPFQHIIKIPAEGNIEVDSRRWEIPQTGGTSMSMKPYSRGKNKKCENWFVKNQQGFRIKLETKTNKTTSIFCGMSALSQVALYKFKVHSDHTVGLPYVCLLSLLHNFSCFSRFFSPKFVSQTIYQNWK